VSTRKIAAVVFAVVAGIFAAGIATAGRDSSGTASRPAGNPVTSGSQITASWGNTLTADIYTELTSSLDRSGRGGMLAALKLYSGGNAATPEIQWLDDGDTGFFLAADGQPCLSVAGTSRWCQTAAGQTETGWLEVAGTMTVAGAATLADVTGDDATFDTVTADTVDATAAVLDSAAIGTTTQGQALFDDVTIGNAPTADTHAATKDYVDDRGWVRVVATTDTSTTGNADIAGLTFQAEANKTYLMRGTLWVYAAATTTGHGVSCKSTGAPTLSGNGRCELWHTNSSNVVETWGASVFTDAPTPRTSTGRITAANPQRDAMEGYFVTTGTGTIALTITSEVGGSAVTVMAGSYLEYTTVD
jgi:hypothetical protein